MPRVLVTVDSSGSADLDRRTQNAFGFHASIELRVRVAVFDGLSRFMTSIRSRSPRDANDQEVGPVNGLSLLGRAGGAGADTVNDARAKEVPNQCQF